MGVQSTGGGRAGRTEPNGVSGHAVHSDVHVQLSPAPATSSLARVRARTLRELAAGILPRSVLFVRGPRSRRRRRIALTFDDGPDAMTHRYIDVLARLGVRATFFLVGENVARAPELAREYVRRGHEVGGHGWTHESFAAMPASRLAEELARTRAVLPPAASVRPLVRPPRGSLSARALLQIATAGYTTVLWSRDSDDCRSSDPHTIARRLAPEAVRNGDVVLLHEMQPWTLEALPPVVSALRRRGWELVTLTELLG
jgi:peptidoglycan/xylan/chitin deacetylase (PgdA/CDA1 family)